MWRSASSRERASADSCDPLEVTERRAMRPVLDVPAFRTDSMEPSVSAELTSGAGDQSEDGCSVGRLRIEALVPAGFAGLDASLVRVHARHLGARRLHPARRAFPELSRGVEERLRAAIA